jgi:hypothetical protein
MDTEVKKRGADSLAHDVSYKEAKHLSKYHGESVFSGLATGLNNIGEVRLQHHVVTDGHDQLERPLRAMADTMEVYGQEATSYVSSDKPAEDKAFYQHVLPGVRARQERLDQLCTREQPVHTEAAGATGGRSYFELVDRAVQVCVVDTEGAINTKALALRNAIADGPIADQKFSLDGACSPLACLLPSRTPAYPPTRRDQWSSDSLTHHHHPPTHPHVLSYSCCS